MISLISPLKAFLHLFVSCTYYFCWYGLGGQFTDILFIAGKNKTKNHLFTFLGDSLSSMTPTCTSLICLRFGIPTVVPLLLFSSWGWNDKIVCPRLFFYPIPGTPFAHLRERAVNCVQGYQGLWLFIPHTANRHTENLSLPFSLCK